MLNALIFFVQSVVLLSAIYVSAEDLNRLLKTAHTDAGKQGQLKEIHL